MQLNGDQLFSHLGKTLASCYFIQSNEILLISEAVDAIRAKAKQAEFTERQVLYIDSDFNWENLAASNQNLSLFGTKKLLELNIPSGKVGVEGSKAIQSFCQRLSPDVLTLVLTPKLDQQAQAGKWVVALNEVSVVVTLPSIKREDFSQWIKSRLQRQQQEADVETLQLLADKSEGNLLAAVQEIQKLGLLYPTGKLSFEQVNKAVLDVARYDLYQLGDALLEGDVSRFSKILAGLKAEGEATVLVLWQLSDIIRTLLSILNAVEHGENLAQALRKARVWGSRQALMTKAVRRLNKKFLLGLLEESCEIDKLIKGLKRGDVWDRLRQLGLVFTLTPDRYSLNKIG